MEQWFLSHWPSGNERPLRNSTKEEKYMKMFKCVSHQGEIPLHTYENVRNLKTNHIKCWLKNVNSHTQLVGTSNHF